MWFLWFLCFCVFAFMCFALHVRSSLRKTPFFVLHYKFTFDRPLTHSWSLTCQPGIYMQFLPTSFSPDLIFSSTLDCHEGVFSFVKYGLQVILRLGFFYSTEIHKKLKPPVFILYEADIICVLSPLFVKQAIFLLLLLPSSLSGLFDLSSSLVFKTPIKDLPAVRVNLS